MLSSLPVQLANVFLIAYATDAGFSLFVDAFLHDGGDLLVRSVRNSIAYFVLLLALLLLPVLAVAARLPTFPLLVLSTSALWFSMGGAPVALLLNSTDDLPLSGMRALELSEIWAGPYCGCLLSDMGAEVIKIERPTEGDPAREMEPFFQDQKGLEKSIIYQYLNTQLLPEIVIPSPCHLEYFHLYTLNTLQAYH